MIMIEILLFVIAVYLSAYVGYSLFLCIVNRIVKDVTKEIKEQKTRFAVLIPAHNEELLIGRLIESLLKQDYSAELYDVIVVADNCNDRTKEVAANYAVRILERQDSAKKGKGYAISFALDNIELDLYDAVFIIDADSIAEINAIKNLDCEVQQGKKVVQCLNGVENTLASWFTVLMNVSRTLSNEILEPAANKIGLSSHLVGNGMCFTTDIIKKFGWKAFSVGEDWEQHAKLIEDGEKIWFSKNVCVYHQESESLRQASSQRLRWSGGRFSIAWRYGFKLLLIGVVQRNIVKISGSLPLVFPNPSLGANLTLLCLLMSSLLLFSRGDLFLFSYYAIILIGQATLFIVGVAHTQHKLVSLASLCMAPLFLIWKIAIDTCSVFGIGTKVWVRTERRL